MEKLGTVVRVIAHTKPGRIQQLSRKKAHVMEIQINGGTTKEKLKYARSLLEKHVPIESVFKKDEMIDTMSITKGYGFQGVVKRWGVRKLPRKTHKGLRKVACIGSWHPERVRYSVARAGQMGSFHRTTYNRKIYQLGKKESKAAVASGKAEPVFNGRTEFDMTDKGINPMGSFPHYGPIRQPYVMVKGQVSGPDKRVITLRKTILPAKGRDAREVINLKFIDTSSKIGKGRFQTHKEKTKWMGPLKKDLARKREKEIKLLALEKKKREEAKKNEPAVVETVKPETKKSKKQKK